MNNSIKKLHMLCLSFWIVYLIINKIKSRVKQQIERRQYRTVMPQDNPPAMQRMYHLGDAKVIMCKSSICRISRRHTALSPTKTCGWLVVTYCTYWRLNIPSVRCKSVLVLFHLFIRYNSSMRGFYSFFYVGLLDVVLIQNCFQIY